MFANENHDTDSKNAAHCPTILIADDDPIVRRLLSDGLASEGYEIYEAGDGESAVDLFMRCRPDIVLIDAMMPRMDGFTACRRLKELPNGKQTPVLMVTSLNDDDSVELAFIAGATDYVTKPVHWAVLRHRVKRLLAESKAEKHITHLAYHDVLTGLPNRLMLTMRLEQMLHRAQRDQTRIGVLFVDLDRFKAVNDTYGHETGDRLLQHVAKRLRGSLRATDIIGRFGGDEFVVLIEDLQNMHGATTVADCLLDALKRPISLEKDEIIVSVSVGIAVYPDHGSNIEQLLQQADNAMYRVKEAGRQHYLFFQAGAGTKASRREDKERKLRAATERKEFEVYYQPLIEQRTGAIVGVEALARLRSGDNVLLPDQFILLAEETGLINGIGEQILEKVCQDAIRWENMGCPLPVSVNVSPYQFNDPHFAETVARVLQNAKLAKDRLILELPESVVMKNPEAVVEVLNKLKSLGTKLAIDDFGTGYSSLSYLKSLPIDVLKIDRSFVRDLPHDQDYAAIAAAIMALSRSLDFKVIAEGIERKEQADYLKDCDAQQGFLYFTPLPAEEFFQLLLANQNLVGPSLFSN